MVYNLPPQVKSNLVNYLTNNVVYNYNDKKEKKKKRRERKPNQVLMPYKLHGLQEPQIK